MREREGGGADHGTGLFARAAVRRRVDICALAFRASGRDPRGHRRHVVHTIAAVGLIGFRRGFVELLPFAVGSAECATRRAGRGKAEGEGVRYY